MLRKSLFPILISLYAIILPAQAQITRLITTDEGLPSSHVHNIFQDNDGFMWIASDNGLCRYDGTDFTYFNHDVRHSSSLEHDNVNAVYQDSKGVLWIGTAKGLQVLDSEYDRFISIDLKPKNSDYDLFIKGITEVSNSSGEKEILVSTSRDGIFVLNMDTHEPVDTQRESLAGLLPSQYINTMYVDDEGTLWISSGKGGIEAIDYRKQAILNNEIWRTLGDEVHHTIIASSFAEDKTRGILYLGCNDYGIIAYDRHKKEIQKVNYSSNETLMITALLIDRDKDGLLMIGTENQGIKALDIASGQVSDYKIEDNKTNLQNAKIHNLLQDRQGNLWANAYMKGILLVPKKIYGFENFSVIDPISKIENTSEISCIETGTEKGTLWIGTDGNGIFKNKDGVIVEHITSKDSPLDNDSITDMVSDKNGNLWIATYLGGLFYYNRSQGVRKFEEQKKIGNEKTVALCYDESRDFIYVATLGNGFSILDASEKSFIKSVSDDNTKWTNTLYADSSGILWIGTPNGPATYDPRTEQISRIIYNDGQDSDIVSCFCQGNDGVMWIGTFSELVCYDRTDGTYSQMDEFSGLSNHRIKGIITRDNGDLWVSTTNGLNRINTRSKHCMSFFSNDGLRGNEFNQGSVCRIGNDLLFGSNDGITIVRPQEIAEERRDSPTVYFSRLSVKGENIRYDYDSSENIIDKQINHATEIRLPKGNSSISLHVSFIEYSNPKRVNYIYKLEGLDKDWETGGTNHLVKYNSLPRGRYNLKIRAYFDDNINYSSEKSIKVLVPAPFYFSTIAVLIYMITLIFTITQCIWAHRRKIKIKEEQEASRIKEMKLDMFTNLSHEIRTPLTLVMSPLQEMRQRENDPQKKDIYNLMYRNSLRILRLINQLMDLRKIDNGQMKLQFEKTDIIFFVKDIVNSFENLALSKSIALQLDIQPDCLEAWIDRDSFDKIMLNLLSNAFKYTPDRGTISISISRAKKNNGILNRAVDNYFEISVKNSGSHLDPDDLEKVFKRFYQSAASEIKTGSGVGLNLAKEYVSLHYGKILAENVTGGVCFTIQLPSGCKHLSPEQMSGNEDKDLYSKMGTYFKEMTPTLSAEQSIINNEKKGKPSVVVVDDDTEMLGYINATLSDLYNIKLFTNAKEAWSFISSSIPDAVVTDLILGETDGAALCSKIKSNSNTNLIPVIMLTAKNDERTVTGCTDCGVDRFLVKPASIELLKSCLSQVISTRRAIKNKYCNDIDYNYDEIKIDSIENNFAVKIVNIIKENMDNAGFSVEDLSKEIGISRVHLNRKMKEVMSTSPNALIKSIRLKQAAYLLINNNVNISEVAYRVGYSAHSYFSSSFRDYFGMTPKEFVALYGSNPDNPELKKILEM